MSDDPASHTSLKVEARRLLTDIPAGDTVVAA
jgi:hypothetical protein